LSEGTANQSQSICFFSPQFPRPKYRMPSSLLQWLSLCIHWS